MAVSRGGWHPFLAVVRACPCQGEEVGVDPQKAVGGERRLTRVDWAGCGLEDVYTWSDIHLWTPTYVPVKFT